MSSVTLTAPPIATARLVVDTDVASYIFKWHPEFAPRYVAIVRGSELVISFMTLAEMRQGALDANSGHVSAMCWNLPGRLLSPSFRQLTLLHLGHRSSRERAEGESNEFSRCMDCRRGAGPLSAAGDEQSQGLPPPGQAPNCFHSEGITDARFGACPVGSKHPPLQPLHREFGGIRHGHHRHDAGLDGIAHH